jgi:hypothetical protein
LVDNRSEGKTDQGCLPKSQIPRGKPLICLACRCHPAAGMGVQPSEGLAPNPLRNAPRQSRVIGLNSRFPLATPQPCSLLDKLINRDLRYILGRFSFREFGYSLSPESGPKPINMVFFVPTPDCSWKSLETLGNPRKLQKGCPKHHNRLRFDSVWPQKGLALLRPKRQSSKSARLFAQLMSKKV